MKSLFRFLVISLLTAVFAMQVSGNSNKALDSLTKVYTNSKTDTAKAINLHILLKQLNSYGKKELFENRLSELRILVKKISGNLYNGLLSLNEALLYENKGDTSKAYNYYNRAVKQLIDSKNDFYLSDAYNLLGYFYFHTRYDQKKAVETYNLAVQKAISSKNDKVLCTVSNSLGLVYFQMADHKNALKCYLRAVKVAEKLGSLRDEAMSYTNMGAVYSEQKDPSGALLYFKKALDIAEKLKLSNGIAMLNNNIGVIFMNQKKYNLAIACFEKSLTIKRRLNDRKKLGSTLDNLGEIYIHLKKYEKAEEYLTEAFELHKELQDNYGCAYSLEKIGELNFEQGKTMKAIGILQKSIEFAKKGEAKQIEKNAYKDLYKSYRKLSKTDKALEYLELYSALNDSLFSKSIQKELAEMKTKYETEKKEQEIKILNQEKEFKNLEIKNKNTELKKQRIIIISIAGVLIIIILFGFVITKLYYKIKSSNAKLAEQKKEIENKNAILKEQNEEIKTQKDEIEAQRDEIAVQRDTVTAQKEQIESIHEELKDSIICAERIQKAVLPGREFIGERLKHDFFILYKPKDIVSGDFYFIEKRKNWTLVTVADCTGHGVPGALMSMLGLSFLQEIIAKEEIIKASHVLDELRKYIIFSLQQKGLDGEQKEGMDVGFIALNNDTLEMEFAGANRPCWIMRSNEISAENSTIEIEEIKPDKQSICYSQKMEPFKNNNIKLGKNDTLYLMSDGAEDQFGGPKGKKFYAKQLKQILIQSNSQTMESQRITLENALESWKKTADYIYEQTDDITIIGLRIT